MSHEEEIQLRLKFEEKLNTLHSLNRCFQDAAHDASKKLQNTQQEMADLREEMEKNRIILKETRTRNDQLEQYKVVTEGRMSLMNQEQK